jgi:hypothetical protein
MKTRTHATSAAPAPVDSTSLAAGPSQAELGNQSTPGSSTFGSGPDASSGTIVEETSVHTPSAPAGHNDNGQPAAVGPQAMFASIQQYLVLRPRISEIWPNRFNPKEHTVWDIDHDEPDYASGTEVGTDTEPESEPEDDIKGKGKGKAKSNGNCKAKAIPVPSPLFLARPVKRGREDARDEVHEEDGRISSKRRNDTKGNDQSASSSSIHRYLETSTPKADTLPDGVHIASTHEASTSSSLTSRAASPALTDPESLPQDQLSKNRRWVSSKRRPTHVAFNPVVKVYFPRNSKNYLEWTKSRHQIMVYDDEPFVDYRKYWWEIEEEYDCNAFVRAETNHGVKEIPGLYRAWNAQLDRGDPVMAALEAEFERSHAEDMIASPVEEMTEASMAARIFPLQKLAHAERADEWRVKREHYSTRKEVLRSLGRWTERDMDKKEKQKREFSYNERMRKEETPIRGLAREMHGVQPVLVNLKDGAKPLNYL